MSASADQGSELRSHGTKLMEAKKSPEQTLGIPKADRSSNKTYKGFVAGVFSGIAKLSGELGEVPMPP